MATVWLTHRNPGAAADRKAALRAEGHQVTVHSSTGSRMEPRSPDVVVSIDRLPAHGREVVDWFWSAKRRRCILVVFAGGASDQVAATRASFPGAVHCPTGGLATTVAALGSS